MKACEHGMPVSIGCDDCTISRLREQQRQDTELIRQMLDAFKTDRLEIEDWPELSRAAIAAAKARLGEPI